MPQTLRPASLFRAGRESSATRRPFRSWGSRAESFAPALRDAELILRGLLTRAEDGMIFIDVPATNQAAVFLANALNLAPSLVTSRMYRGPAPEIDTTKIFGITSLELG